jgi:hypothetical protein
MKQERKKSNHIMMYSSKRLGFHNGYFRRIK